jgi:glycosyltransferase involved in cell wall biosynthesis
MIDGVDQSPFSPASSLVRGQASIILTSYNHQGFVEQCLESIAGQNHSARQVIIVDDGSTDDSVAVIDQWLHDSGLDYQFIRHEKNYGLCASLNQALGFVDSEYYFQVSSDDWEESDRVERQLDAFNAANPDVAVMVGDFREVEVGGGTVAVHDSGQRLLGVLPPATSVEVLTTLLTGNVIPATSVMLRTAAVRAVGGYDESLYFEDYDLWMRLSLQYQIGYSPGVVANYRVSPTSMLNDPGKRVQLLTSEALMLAKHIGSSETNDTVISGRLIGLTGNLIQLEAVTAVRTVLEYACLASREPWLREMLKTSRRRNSIAALKDTYAARLV